MLVQKIGITGTIASGKTYVSSLLKKRGFPVFNSDQYARMATHAQNPCFAPLAELLGSSVIDEQGDIDRRKMAAIIFNDEEKRLKVNEIVHPYVIAGMNHFFDSNENRSLVFAEVPLLFEAGLETYFDKILVITCAHDTAVSRMMKDRGYKRTDAEERYSSQLDPEIQKQKATDVIYNDSDKNALEEEVNLWLRKIRNEGRHGN
jgi:dephospho-CoA kinase